MKQVTEYTLTARTESRISGRALRWICLLAGALAGLSFPPYGIFVLGWFCLIPVLFSVQFSSTRDAFINAWLFYLGLYAIAFNWPLLHLRTDTAIASGFAWISLTMVHAAAFGLARTVCDRFRLLPPVFVAGLFVLLIDLILRLGPVPMPGTSLAYSQTMSGLMIKSASVIGSNGISVAVVACNCLLTFSLLQRPSERTRWLVYAGLSVFTVMAAGLVSQVSPTTKHLSVLVIQPGYSAQAWSDVQSETRTPDILAFTDSIWTNELDAESSTDVVIWPETTLPIVGSSFDDSRLIDTLESWSAQQRVPLLTGAIVKASTRQDEGPEYFNSALLIGEKNGPTAVSKNILVPFAEHVPFSKTFSFLNTFAVPAGGVPGYSPGSKPSVVEIEGVRVGVLICFESHFPEYSASLTGAGGQVVVLLTQNGWWRGAAPYEQNFNYARLRASEQNRSIIVSSVNGVSGVIDSQGGVVHRSRVKSKEWFTFDVPIVDGVSIYNRFGYLGYWIGLGIWGMYLLFYARRKSNTAHSSNS